MSAPAASPIKVPMKIPMKIVMKAPMPAGGVAAKIPMAAPKVPVPAPVRPPVVAAPKPAAKPIVDDEEDLLLGTAVKAPVVAKKVVVPATKRARTPSPSSSSSSSGSSASDSDEEEMTLFSFAKSNALISNEFKDEDLEAPMELGAPAQPVKQRVSSDIDADITKLLADIAKVETTMQIKEDTKTVSLGTSKTNYIDPRIVYAFAKRMNMDSKKLLSGTLNDKFVWAHGTDPDYQF